MYDSQYISDILEYADKHSVDVRVTEKGGIRMTALRKTPQAKRTIELLNRVYKQNKVGLRQKIIENQTSIPFDAEIGQGVVSAIKSLTLEGGPSSAAFDALAGLSALQPEAGLPLTLGVGAGAGAIGAIGSDQSLLGGAETGAISAAHQIGFGKAIKGGKYALAWARRPHNFDLAMMSGIGQVVSNAIQEITPKAASRIIKSVAEFGAPGKSTVIHVLNSGEANQELEQSWKQMQEAVASEAENSAKERANTLTEQAKKKYPKDQKVVDAQQYMEDLNAVKEAVEHAKVVRHDILNAFDDIGGQNRASFTPGGELKHSYSAWKMQTKSVPELEQHLQKEIQEADSTGQLANMLAHTRDLYGKFKGLQDFVNIDNVVTGGKSLGKNLQANDKWFEPATLQKAIDPQTNPAIRFVQRRIKDAYEPLKQVIKRNAPDMIKGEPAIADRVMGAETLEHIRTGQHIPWFGHVYAHLPIPRAAITSHIGEELGPAGIGKRLGIPTQSAGRLPVLLNAPLTAAEEEPDQTNQSIIMPPQDENASVP